MLEKLATRVSAPRTPHAAVLLLAFASVLLAEPIVRHATHTFTSADLLQDYALTSWDDGASVANRGLYDPAAEMQPWLVFNRDELRAGRLPLWNPYNGNGAPHHANYQSAVFSPFSVPFYVLRFKDALIVSALSKLFLLGLFTYLFLRAIAFGFLPALFSATAFMLNGKSVMLLGYPHSAVAVALPFALWCVERAAQTLEARAPPRRFASWLAGLGAAFVLGIYAGHPEPLVFVGGLSFGWAAWRGIGIARRLGRGAAAKLVGGFLAASAVALLLGAPQILPFLEYFRLSSTFGTRQAEAQPSLVDWWPLLVYPSAVGSPRAHMAIRFDLPSPNYEQVNTSYPGGAVLMLALIGIYCLREDRRVRLFALGVAAWLLLTCDVGGLGRAWDSIPWIGTTVLLSRSQVVWLFGVAALAGVAVDRLLAARRTRASPLAAALVLLVGGAALAACTWQASELLDRHLSGLEQALPRVRGRIESERWQLGVTTAAALLAVAAALVVPGRAAKRAWVAALIAIVVFQNGWMLARYNPTVPDRLVYPTTPAIAALQREARDRSVLVLTDNGLPPDTNLMYRVAIPQNYDALGVKRFEELARWTLGSYGPWRWTRWARPEHLALFGIEYVITAGDWVPIGTRTWNRRGPDRPLKQPLPLRPGMRVEQPFVCDTAFLDSVTVLVSTLRHGSALDLDLELALVDEHEQVVAERSFGAEELRANALRESDIAFAHEAFAPTRKVLSSYATLSFAPIERSRGRSYRLLAGCTRARGEDAAILWYVEEDARDDHRLRVDGVPREATLECDYRAHSGSFEKVAQLGRLSLHRFRPSLGAFFAVSESLEVPASGAPPTPLFEPGFRPYQTVVLGPDDPGTVVGSPGLPPAPALTVVDPAPARDPAAAPPSEPATRAEIVARTPTEVRLRVVRRDGGWLVACQTWFPGWTATVNGRERPVRRANHAFQAVELDAGLNEVVLRYRPRSLVAGAWLAVAGALAGALGWLAVSRARTT